jgi:GT2 family glycosyltransferase
LEKTSPSVSVIIVNWNRLDDVLASLRVLSRIGASVEILVVDNGSTDGSTERLACIEEIRLIALPENVGPATARNVAIGVARGRHLLFLDSDATITGPAIRRLVDRMDRDPSIGVIGCRIVNYRSRAIDQWIYAEARDTHARREFETYSFSAAGAIVRAETLRRAGPFWDDLFIYNEELDISIRIIRSGYRILYSPDAEVYHRASEAGRVHSSSYWFYQIRNQIWIFFRYYPSWVRWWKVSLYMAVYLVKGVANRQLRACVSGMVAGLSRARNIAGSDDTMTAEECRRFDALNRRFSLRIGR